MKIELDTRFKSHVDFLKYVNVTRKGEPTQLFEEIRAVLDLIVAWTKHPDEWAARDIYGEIEHLFGKRFEPILKFDLPRAVSDGEQLSVRRFWRNVKIRPSPQNQDVYIHLLDLFIKGGLTRIGRCVYCEDYFLAYRASKDQRFCPGVNGRKSKCAVSWHIGDRSKRAAEIRAEKSAKQKANRKSDAERQKKWLSMSAHNPKR